MTCAGEQGVQQYNVPGDHGHLARMAALEAAKKSGGEPGELLQRSSGLSASALSGSFLGALGQQRRATSQVRGSYLAAKCLPTLSAGLRLVPFCCVVVLLMCFLMWGVRPRHSPTRDQLRSVKDLTSCSTCNTSRLLASGTGPHFLISHEAWWNLQRVRAAILHKSRHELLSEF